MILSDDEKSSDRSGRAFARAIQRPLILIIGIGICFGSRITETQAGNEMRLGLPRRLSMVDRVAYQYAIEEVYWRHRIWPKENAGAKPSLEEVMSPPKSYRR